VPIKARRKRANLDIGANLWRWRWTLGITQEELAGKKGRRQLQRIERGALATKKTAEKYAQALARYGKHVTVDDLITKGLWPEELRQRIAQIGHENIRNLKISKEGDAVAVTYERLIVETIEFPVTATREESVTITDRHTVLETVLFRLHDGASIVSELLRP